MPDNWTGRSKGQTCKTCISFVEKVPTDTNKTYTVIGRCRHHAPIAGFGYPAVYPDDYCGDYKPDENKL
jgi:hypothetical protein